ncbi:glycosyltransferase [Bacillus spongiae]|uniref:Glycosyltransferase n=1 Tax=Bacillus spongiae TaxID=2683610 RepID=A0ABU8H959_9BACI
MNSLILQPNTNYYSTYLLKEEEREEYLESIVGEYFPLLEWLHSYTGNAKIAFIVKPVLFEWFTTEEFKAQIDQFFTVKRGMNAQYQTYFQLWLKWDKNIIKAFQNFSDKGVLRLIPSTPSDFPLTHIQTKQGMEWQLETTVAYFQKHFSVKPKGIWLPRQAYQPGLDKYLVNFGFQYTFIPYAAFEFAEKDSPVEQYARSPRGLTLIPIRSQLGQERARDSDVYLFPIHGKEVWRPFFEETITTFLTSGRDDCIEVEGWEKVETTLSRMNFCYNGMDIGKPILSDQQLQLCRKGQEIELQMQHMGTTLQQHDVLEHIVLEWMHLLTTISDGRHDQGTCQATDLLVKSFQEGQEEKHFLIHRKEKLLISLPLSKKPRVGIQSASVQVLILSWEYPPNIVGGLSRHVYSLAKNLSRKGVGVVVLTSKSPDTKEYEKMDGVHVYRTGPLHQLEENFLKWIEDLNVSMVRKADELINRHHINIVHAHDWLVGQASQSIKSFYHIPLVTTIHATEHGRNAGIYTEMQQRIHNEESKLINDSNHVIVCSDYMKDELKQLFDVENKTISMIPNGIHLGEVEEMNHMRFHFLENKRFIFSVGRVVREKGFDTLIDAASLLPGDLEIVIAGKGPLLNNYRQTVNDRGLQVKIHFIGFVTDEERNQLLNSCEMAVFPSLYEPFGIVALEAMAAKKPVIAARIGGLKGIIQHEFSGLLYTPGSADELMIEMNKLYQSSSLREKIGQQGFQVARKLFGWERIADQTKQVYEEEALHNKLEGAFL